MSPVLRAMIIGAGATVGIDLWAFLLRRAFATRSLDFCLVGRWLLHLRTRLVHQDIARAEPRRRECLVGWTAHYLIGTGFAVAFVLTAEGWLAHPTLLPALAFGAATVAVPFLILQPALGLGIASSRVPRPHRARLKSLATHLVFGGGLYLWASVLGALHG